MVVICDCNVREVSVVAFAWVKGGLPTLEHFLQLASASKSVGGGGGGGVCLCVCASVCQRESAHFQFDVAQNTLYTTYFHTTCDSIRF